MREGTLINRRVKLPIPNNPILDSCKKLDDVAFIDINKLGR
mgnify:CR=1 FL=1